MSEEISWQASAPDDRDMMHRDASPLNDAQATGAFSAMNISGRHACIVNVERRHREQRKLIVPAFERI